MFLLMLLDKPHAKEVMEISIQINNKVMMFIMLVCLHFTHFQRQKTRYIFQQPWDSDLYYTD